MKPILLVAIFACTMAASSLFAAEKKSVEFLNSSNTNMPFSEAVRVGDLLFLSGNIGVIPGTMKLAAGGIQGQAEQTMENVKATLQTHGYDMSDIVKCLVMLADIEEWGDFNEVYKRYFTPPYPARSAFAASGLALGARVEVECTAAR